MSEIKEITREDLYKKISEVYYIKDTKIIDLLLAIHISRTQTFKQIWVMLLSNSGNGKTDLLSLFEDEGITTRKVKRLTANTLVNSRNDNHLALELDNKVVHIPEMAQIFNMNDKELKVVIAQLTDLYDGELISDSAITSTKAEDLNVTLIGCSTISQYERQSNFRNAVGTRELVYKMPNYSAQEDEIIRKLIKKNVKDPEIKNKKKEINKLILEYIKQHPYQNFDMSEEIENQIDDWENVVRMLRASVEFNNSNGELESEPEIEGVGRLSGQFSVLYNCLKSMDNYEDAKALEIIKDLAFSNCNRNRLKILFHLIKHYDINGDVSLTKQRIANAVNLNKNTVFKELNLMADLRLNLIWKEANYKDESEELAYYKFKLNPNSPIIKFLLNNLDFVTNINNRIREEELNCEVIGR